MQDDADDDGVAAVNHWQPQRRSKGRLLRLRYPSGPSNALIGQTLFTEALSSLPDCYHSPLVQQKLWLRFP